MAAHINVKMKNRRLLLQFNMDRRRYQKGQWEGERPTGRELLDVKEKRVARHLKCDQKVRTSGCTS